ncbi:MAG: metallophosphoesterase [Chloroflexi bacterium]|nr:metallophosphoesterase [Chloroflexota bacterium]
MTKLAIVTDAHWGPAKPIKSRKLTQLAEPLLADFVRHVNNQVKPDAVLQLGDLIEDIMSDEGQNMPSSLASALDLDNYLQGWTLLDGCKCPVYHVAGNHDTWMVDPDALTSVWNTPEAYYSVDVGDAHVVILYTQSIEPQSMTTHVPHEQLMWLKDDLAATDKPVIICSHYSLADQDLTGNYWFEGLPQECLVQNRADVRAVIASAGNVMVAFNGHLHWNNVTEHDGIPYITIQSLTQDIDGSETPAKAYAEVTIKDGFLWVEVMGNDPFLYQR